MVKFLRWHLLFAGTIISLRAETQCDQLAKLLTQLNQLLTEEQQKLKTPVCEGSASTICSQRISALSAQISTDVKILKTCKNGVIPTSGIPAPPPHLPFNLTPHDASDFDTSKFTENPRWDVANGIQKNPLWASQLYDNALPDAGSECFASIWSYHPSDWLPCTQDPVWINQAKCGGGGHVNWNPVTYEGKVQWDSHSGNDDDYNIRISRLEDQALYTADDTSSVNMEFDSDETIDHFSIDAWWKSFHKAVDSGNKNPSGINGRPAIAVGLLGLDYEHGGFTELHPLYALAINTEGSKWSFFIRNWGDEGYCSSGVTRWDATAVRVLFPNTSAANGQVVSGAFYGTNGTGVSAQFVAGKGLLFEAQLPPPSENGMVVGELAILFTPSAPLTTAFKPSRAKYSVPQKAKVSQELSTEEQIEKTLSTSARKTLLADMEKIAAAEPVSVSRLTLKELAPNRTLNPAQGSAVRLGEPANRSAQKNAALCRALGSESVHFPDLCK